MAAPPRLALIYCRVSTRAQAEKWSLPAQERLLVEHAERQGWAYEVHRETGSGDSIAARPVFRALLERVAAGEAHTLLVIESDRLTRPTDLRDLALLHECARAGECRIATPAQSLDMTNGDDTLLSTIFGAVAAREKTNIRKKCARGMAEAKAAGRWHGGGVPTGYVYDKNKKTIVPSERADEVRLLLEGALTRGARSLRDQFPSWSPTAIQRALTRQRVWWYAGRVLLEDGTTIPAAWEAIITEDQALALHSAREKKKRVRDHSPQAKRLLTGLGVWRCGHCGTSMKSQTYSHACRDGSTSRYYAYRCNPWWVKQASHDCPNKGNLRCQDVDPAVLRALWDAIPALLAAPRAGEGAARPPSPTAEELAAATARRERLVAAVEDGTLTAAEARDRLTAARREIARLTEALEAEASPAGPVVISRELMRHLSRKPEKAPTKVARELVRLTCRRVEIYDRTRIEVTLMDGRKFECRVD